MTKQPICRQGDITASLRVLQYLALGRYHRRCSLEKSHEERRPALAIDPKDLTKIPETAASSRIKYVRFLDADQVLEFFQGLFETSVSAKDSGKWEHLSQYLDEWENKAVNTLLLGRYAYETGPWAPLA